MGRRKKTEIETKPVEVEVEPVEVEIKPVEVESKPVETGVFVADGKYVNCLRGVLRPGTQVFPKDFPGGEDTIKQHIECGGLVVREISR